MVRQVVAGVIATGLVVSSVEVQPAQSADSCQVTLAEATHQIGAKNAYVDELKTYDMSQESTDKEYPEEYPITVAMIISGPGAENVMNSPVFLKALSHKIIMGCESVSLVAFALTETDYVREFGLIGPKVEEFKCIPAGSTSPSVLPWGYTICI